MKLRFWRQETDPTSREPWESTTAGKNEPPTYVSPLIKGKYNNPDDRVHQRQMALMSAIGYNIVVKLSQNSWDDKFEFIDLDTGKVIMHDIQRKMQALNFYYYYTQALIVERMYGHAWIFCGPEKLREDVIGTTNPRIANLDVFGPENSKVVEYDQYGHPSVLEITVLKGVGPNQTQEVKKRINREDLILLRTRPKPFDRSHEGIPVLYPVWSTLWSLERAFHSSDFYLAKIGHGMYLMITKGSTSDTKLDRLETLAESASVSRILILNSKDVESLSFINASGSPIDFPSEIDSRVGIICAGTGVPKDSLLGVSAGAITGSETNIKALYQTLGQIQTSCEPAIREYVRKEGHTNENYGIRFITRYAHDEEQKSKIAMNDAQTLAIKSGWLTTNEIRELDGYEPIEDGDKLKSDFQINASGFQTPEEEEATNNEEGENT